MEDKIKKLKQQIEESEFTLKDPEIANDAELVKILEQQLKDDKDALEKLEKEAAAAVEAAKVEVKEVKEEVKAAEKVVKEVKKGDNKNAQKKAEAKLASIKKNLDKSEEELDEAEGDKKAVAKVAEKAKDVEKKSKEAIKKSEKAIADEKKHGGFRPNAGRKPDPNRVVKPKGQQGGFRAGAGRKPVHAIPAKKDAVKPKEVKIWGTKVSWSSEAEFCKKLQQAYLNRRKEFKAKGKGHKTKPIFDVITSKVAGALTSAARSIPQARIQRNPKDFLSKFMRLEKSAQRFLEDFKAILGSDYKKSDITKELGDVEKTINSIMAKYEKK